MVEGDRPSDLWIVAVGVGVVASSVGVPIGVGLALREVRANFREILVVSSMASTFVTICFVWVVGVGASALVGCMKVVHGLGWLYSQLTPEQRQPLPLAG